MVESYIYTFGFRGRRKGVGIMVRKKCIKALENRQSHACLHLRLTSQAASAILKMDTLKTNNTVWLPFLFKHTICNLAALSINIQNLPSSGGASCHILPSNFIAHQNMRTTQEGRHTAQTITFESGPSTIKELIRMNLKMLLLNLINLPLLLCFEMSVCI